MDKDTIVGGLAAEWAAIEGLLAGLDEAQWAAPDPVPGLVGARRDLAHRGHRADPVRRAAGAVPGRCAGPLARAQRHRRAERGLGGVAARRAAGPDAGAAARGDRAAAGRADRHGRAGVPRAVVDARRPGHLRAVHADPGLRLLDARAGHPRLGRPAGQRGRAGRGAVGGRDRAGPGLPRGQAGPGPGRVVGDLRPDRAAAAPAARDGGGPGPAGRRAAGPATTSIRLPLGTFTRLCGGRVRPEQVSDQVTVRGDEDLGRQVVSALAYTI